MLDLFTMRVIAISALREFWSKHPDAETPLRSWYAEASRATWRTPGEIKRSHRNASLPPNNRVVFNIKGNDYRLVVAVHYNRGIMFVRFIGTHGQYDRIDATTI
jgi:mRNA interferase HigB